MTDRNRVVQFGRNRKSSQSSSQSVSQSVSSSAESYSNRKPGGIAHLDPSTFSPPFDVLSELADNKEQYAGSEFQTVYAFPNYLRTSLDRVRARVITTNKPGLLPTITCCLSYGLEVLASHPDIVSLITYKSRFDLLEDVDSLLNDEVASVFEHFPLTIPNLALTKSGKQNVALTDALKLRAYNLASELGVSFSTVVILGVMVTLADQPSVLKDRREAIEESLGRFLTRVRVRGTIMQTLLAIFEKNDA